jgi:hypothetical protein
VCIVFTAGISVAAFYKGHILRIEDLSNNKIIFEKAARPGDNIWVVFINSVESLPVGDHYVLDSSFRILFTETIFQAPYAGYDREEEGVLVAPGTVRISGYDRAMKEVTFYAGHVSRHMLFFNGNLLPLYETANGGDIIRIRIINTTITDSILKRIRSHE